MLTGCQTMPTSGTGLNYIEQLGISSNAVGGGDYELQARGQTANGS